MMVRSLSCAVLGVCLCLLPNLGASVGAENVVTPISVEDLLAIRTISNRSAIDLSPDGKLVAYTLELPGHERVTDPRYLFYNQRGVPVEAVHSSVWITNVASAEIIQPVKSAAASWGVSWSPDGNYLAFYSDQGGRASLWVWDRTTRKSRPVSQAIVRPFFGYEVPQWTPDSKLVLVKLLPAGLTILDGADLLIAKPKRSTAASNRSSVVVFSASPGDQPTPANPPFNLARNRYFSDLALIDVRTGSTRRIAPNSYPVAYFLSPDGKQVAYSNLKAFEWETQVTLYDVIVTSTAGRQKPRVISANVKMAYGRGVSWSPDSTQLCYVTSGPTAKGDIYVARVANGETRPLTPDPHPNFGANHYSQPLWDPSGHRVYSVADRNLWTIPVAGGASIPVTRNPGVDTLEIVAPNGKGLFWSPDSGVSAIVSTRDNESKEAGFYSIDLQTGAARRLLQGRKAFGNPLTLMTDVAGKSIVFVSQDAGH